MLTLLTYPPFHDQFSASPFCTKAAFLLNMAGVAWQREDLNDPRKMPYGKLPALRVQDRIVPDSDNIRAYLEDQGATFDAGLSDLDRATSRALIRMVEEHMYFHQAMDRWGNDEVWPHIVKAYFHEIPVVLRKIVTNRLRKQFLQGIRFQGIGRLSEEDRLVRVEPDLVAITTRLWHGKFMFADKITAADASVAAMLGSMRAGPVETALRQRVREDAILSDYVDRVNEAIGTAV